MFTLTKFFWCMLVVAAKAAQEELVDAALPVVELNYERHQALYFNETGRYFNFSNIRYAAPPVGNYRWTAPRVPDINHAGIQTGSEGRICPSSPSDWYNEAFAFVSNYTQGLPFNATAYENSNQTVPVLPRDPRTSEDCLFLDIAVPEDIFKQANNAPSAPVVVWIHGGGYAVGSKDLFGIPAGLLEQAASVTNGSYVFVSINYRLGMFGFAAGSSVQNEGTANAGLLDQRFALEWVQKYISRFGGNPHKVTLIGESAGGGSILHHITAYGGRDNATLFSRAILQSPAPGSYQNPSVLEQNFQDFLRLAGVSSIAQARELPTKTLIETNEKFGVFASYGTSPVMPTIDGSYIPDKAHKLLLRGEFNHNVEVMVGHNALEGLLFTDPKVITPPKFRAFAQRMLPNMNSTDLDYVVNHLYPTTFDGPSLVDNSALQNALLLIGDTLITCHTFYLNTAFNNDTYAYLFNVNPGIHGQDLAYTFYNGPYGKQYDTPQMNATVAEVLQDYIGSFAVDGVPQTDVRRIAAFSKYGKNGMVMQLGQMEGIYMQADPAANERCRWLQTSSW